MAGNAAKPRYGLETLAIHGGLEPDPTTGAVMTPIYQTSTFAFVEPGVSHGYEYTRVSNPTRTALEQNVALLEGAKFGHAFASGVAAVCALLHTLRAGDHIVATDDIYGGTWRAMHQLFSRGGITVTHADLTNPANLEPALTRATKMLWLESPTNPLLKVLDLEKLSAIARKHGVLVVVDNTFATPFFQRPLDHGAHAVLHSTTKYLGGHSDVVGGVIVTSDAALSDELKFVQKSAGAQASPLDCFLTLRGIKTLGVRMLKHSENAMTLAEQLEQHPAVKRVIYPGLKSHPQYALANRLICGTGGVITIELAGGEAAALKLLGSLKLFTLAESLGGVESLVGHPWTMSHGAIPEETKRRIGITEAMVRLSVGIETVYDLWGDLEQALDALEA